MNGLIVILKVLPINSRILRGLSIQAVELQNCTLTAVIPLLTDSILLLGLPRGRHPDKNQYDID
jgi:hypothetical protein